MLRNLNEVRGIAIHAVDGNIGSVDDFYFDDERWAVRYLVVDTGDWLPGRRVLISPISVTGADWIRSRLDLSLTKDQVERSPDVDTHKPVSRQHEVEYANYYGYPYYWYGGGLWGAEGFPAALAATTVSESMEDRGASLQEQADPHLRSLKDTVGYYIEALDGDIGHVDDMLADDKTWAIRYIVVDTGNWLPGKKVIIAPEWIRGMNWAESKVFVDLRRKEIEGAPEYDPAATVESEYEERLYGHYNRPKRLY